MEKVEKAAASLLASALALISGASPLLAAQIRGSVQQTPESVSGGRAGAISGGVLPLQGGAGMTGLVVQPLLSQLSLPQLVALQAQPSPTQPLSAQLMALQAQPIAALERLKVSQEPTEAVLYKVLSHPGTLFEERESLSALIGPDNFQVLTRIANELDQLAGKNGAVRELLASGGNPAAALEEFKKRFDGGGRQAASVFGDAGVTSRGSASKILDEALVGVSGKFIAFEPGEFEMGSPKEEALRDGDEALHSVRLTHRFELQAGPMTQRQYALGTDRNPSYFKDKKYEDGDHLLVNGQQTNADHPVERISWHDAVMFANELSIAEGLQPAYVIKVIERRSDGSIRSADVLHNGDDIYETKGYKDGTNGYRLPTEAEWEYAARAGTKTPYWFDAGKIDDHAWHRGNSGGRTHAVGNAKHANPAGLHDMLGNVLEWVWDWYANYPGATTIFGKKRVTVDPRGPTTGSFRAVRGGSWDDVAIRSLRSASRLYGFPEGYHRLSYFGFRLARSLR